MRKNSYTFKMKVHNFKYAESQLKPRNQHLQRALGKPSHHRWRRHTNNKKLRIHKFSHQSHIMLFNLSVLLPAFLLLTPSLTLATRYNRQQRQQQQHGMYANGGGGNAGSDNGGGSFGNDAIIYTTHNNRKYHLNPNSMNPKHEIYTAIAMTQDFMHQYPEEGSQAPPHSRGRTVVEVDTNSQIKTCETVCVCKWKGGKQTVECIDQLLIQIPDKIDANTQVLDMSGNKLQILSNQQFKRSNLLNLQKLYLRNCKIGEIEPETFKGLTNLVELDLSHNLLVVVPTVALSYMSSLRDLSLASNHIQKVDGKGFQATGALHKLDMSHCEIQVISPQAFDGLTNLVDLRLSGNKLSELSIKTIEKLKSLHSIELHDNPWMCDCRMLEIKQWLSSNNIPSPVPPACAGGPERILNRDFTNLHLEDFACRPEMLPNNHYVEATIGENAAIVCRARGIPPPEIHWYWNGRLLVNNSIIGTRKRVYVYQQGQMERRSRLVITHAEEGDSGDFYCIAENRGGTAEANFTLNVRISAAGIGALTSAQIIALSSTVVVFILLALVGLLFWTFRIQREPCIESKTPNHLEVVASSNQQNVVAKQQQPSAGNGNIGSVVISNGALLNCIDSNNALEHKVKISATVCHEGHTNPVQKPPRLTDLPYTTNSYDNCSIVLATAPGFISPTGSGGNNPDLINDTKRFGSDEFGDLKVTAILSSNIGQDLGNSSGEYSRAGGCDSLYPSGLWESPSVGTSSADDLFIKRYKDKTHIIESNQLFDLQERTSDYFSKTFPRTHYTNLQTNPIANCTTSIQNPSTSTAVLLHGSSGGIGAAGAHSTASTTTTNLSNSSGTGIGGYPNDYGLPLVPGAEHQHNHHLQLHPLQQLQHQLSTAASTSQAAGIGGSPHFSSRTLPRLHDNLTSSRHSPKTKHVSILPNGQPINAKTIRVWQKGGVPVLPPVTALKRALISGSRNSPDEGYQEGGGTDV